jgi:hypothetical protein
MIDLSETARQLQVFCDRQRRRSCFFIGGSPKMGRTACDADFDLTLLTNLGDEATSLMLCSPPMPAR